jgi:predicted TIM-barrel fold metal-dependent hydrolase
LKADRDKPNVRIDTARPVLNERRRLLFGSGFPFGHPFSELEKVLRLNIDEAVKEDIRRKNLPRLYARIRPADAEKL